VIGGLVASTLITLVLIPTVYLGANLGLERVKGWVSARRDEESRVPELAG
jgi:hypothetical protein